jgi:hypothetical protein
MFVRYVLALQPRRLWWAVLTFAVPGVFGFGAYQAAALIDPTPSRFKTMATIIAVVIVLFLGLFWSGYVAWSKEWIKNQDKWPHWTEVQFASIVERMKGFGPYPDVEIHRNDTPDCADLAAQIHDAIRSAGWGVRFSSSARPWAPGVLIAVRDIDERTGALRDALKAVGIPIQIKPAEDMAPHILIGSRPRLS